jgi:hypothetical protein
MSLNFPMKKVTQSLLALLLAALPVTGFAAAADVLFSQKNSSNTAWANVIVAPTASSALAFNSSKVPISTQALTLLSVTAPAGNDLTLAGGSSGASLVLGQGTSGNATLALKASARFNLTAPASNDAYIEYVGNAGTAGTTSVVIGQNATGLGILYNRANSAFTFGTNGTEVSRLTATGNLLIGTTSETGLTGAGGLKINSSTAGAANAGALVVTGGLSAGNNGNASYFGGAVTAPSVTATTTLADQGGTISAQRNGLAPAQGLVFDGTTAATVAVPAMTDGTVAFWINAPAYSGTNPFPVVGAIGSYSTIYVNTSGAIANEGLSQSTSLLPAGVWSFGAVTKSGTTVTYYVNGIAAGSQTQAQSWNASSKIGPLSGSTYPATLRPPVILNRALSAAEVLALYQQGAPAAADYNGVLSNVNLLTAGGPWTNYNSSFNVAFASADGSTVSGTSSTGIGYVYTPITLTAGSRYRITGTATGVTGSTLYVSTTAPILSSPQQGIGTIPLGTSEINFSWEETTGGSRSFVVNTVSAIATSFALTNLRVWKDGLLLAPDSNNAGAGLEWLDVSGNRAHIVLPTSGVSWSLPSSQQIVIEASTSTNGNQQLGGASLIDVNKQWRIQSWTVNCSTGTPTISLGNVSAGAQYNAAAVLAAGNNDITLVTRFPSTANLWVNSNSTATLIHRITLVPAN